MGKSQRKAQQARARLLQDAMAVDTEFHLDGAISDAMCKNPAKGAQMLRAMREAVTREFCSGESDTYRRVAQEQGQRMCDIASALVGGNALEFSELFKGALTLEAGLCEVYKGVEFLKTAAQEEANLVDLSATLTRQSWGDLVAKESARVRVEGKGVTIAFVTPLEVWRAERARNGDMLVLFDIWAYYVRATAKVSKFPTVTLKAWTFLTSVFVFADIVHVVHPSSTSPAILRHALLEQACMYCLRGQKEREAEAEAKAGAEAEGGKNDHCSFAQCPNGCLLLCLPCFKKVAAQDGEQTCSVCKTAPIARFHLTRSSNDVHPDDLLGTRDGEAQPDMLRVSNLSAGMAVLFGMPAYMGNQGEKETLVRMV